MALDRRDFMKGTGATALVMGFNDYSKNFVYATGDEDELEYWTLEKCKRAYLDYVGSKGLELEEQHNSRCYRHGVQWTSGQVEIFNKRKQPIVTYNRIGRKIDAIVGVMEKLKQDPKAYPRNPRQTDEKGADLATAAVRYVVESELRSDKFPFAIENGATEGIGGVEMMLVRGDKGDIDVGFALVRANSFFYDPHSLAHDFEDARYMGQGKWLDVEDAQALAPTREKAREIAQATGSGSELTPNEDRGNRWFDFNPIRKNVRVVDIWYKKGGKWKWCLFTGSTKIDEGEGYFFNEKGEHVCKYIMFSSFVDQDGDRYSFVRNLRSSQDEVNQRRSKGLHELNSRRIKAEDGAFPDIEVARREAVRPDGVVIYNKGFEMEFDDAARQTNIEGQLKFLEDAKAEIENFGPSPALIGQGLEYKSGRAINLLQQAGIAELGPFVIGIKNWKLRLYRAIWNAVQRYWTGERWIRVTDDAGIAQLVQLNGLGIDPMTGLPRMINAVGQLDVNFMLDEGPDEVNMMGDAYDTLVALTAQGANIPPQILLELAPLQGQLKRKLLALLQQEDPATAQAKSIALMSEAAKVDETKSKTALNLAKAQESAQGGAHGLVERQFDAAMKQDEHRMKMTESAMKVGVEREKGQIKAATEFAKLRSNQLKGDQDVQLNAIKGAQQVRQGEEKHQQQLRTMAAKAAAKPNGKGNGQSLPGYQYGGRPTVGEPAVVGEDGPEVFVPDVSGTILPNPKTKSGFWPYQQLIQHYATRYGLDPQVMAKIMKIESGGNPRNVTGSYKGLFQLDQDEFARHGGKGDILNPAQNTAAAASLFARLSQNFRSKYGRDPTAGELYNIHQQGEAGYDAHSRNPGGVAWRNIRPFYGSDEVAKKAVWGNLPDSEKARLGSVDNVKSSDLTGYWGNRMEGTGWQGTVGTAGPGPSGKGPGFLPSAGDVPVSPMEVATKGFDWQPPQFSMPDAKVGQITAPPAPQGQRLEDLGPLGGTPRNLLDWAGILGRR